MSGPAQTGTPIFPQPTGHHLAELNIATSVADLDDPAMAGFMNALDAVNAIAERSPGFVWRLKDESGNATGIKGEGDPRGIHNLSAWERAEDLEFYIWNTVHRRHQWFKPQTKPYFAMWWIEAGTVPTLDEALARLEHLRANGLTGEAFGWGNLQGTRLWEQAGAPPVAE